MVCIISKHKESLLACVKAKTEQDEIKEMEATAHRGQKPVSPDFNCAEKKGQRVFNSWDEVDRGETVGHLCLLICLPEGKVNFLMCS